MDSQGKGMINYAFKRILKPLCATVCLAGLSSSAPVFAGGFQLWEQNVTNIENFHAGRAALANDASTAYDNPAGITRIKNQQVVVGAMGIMTDIRFDGQIATCTTIGGVVTCGTPTISSAQGGNFTLIPDLHYVAPLSSNWGFGLSVVSPYGSDVEWGQSSFISPMVSRARLQVVDIAPGFGLNLTNKLSVGLGLDIEKMSAQLDSILVSLPSITRGYDTAYGYHAGVLYEFSTATRAGMAYHSQVIHHLKGTSTYNGDATRSTTSFYLPPDTTLSVYHSFNPQWAVMGSIVYTQWNIVHNTVINGISGFQQLNAGVPLALDFPQNFRNTWTYSIGADYSPTDKLTLRAGVGFDQTPTRNGYRILQLPDSDRYDLAVGGHYQVSKAFGFDLGWTRVFLQRAAINPPLHPELYPISLQQQAQGKIFASGDVFGAQATWNFL
jgi:long-chain fatty acid transport protein